MEFDEREDSGEKICKSTLVYLLLSLALIGVVGIIGMHMMLPHGRADWFNAPWFQKEKLGLNYALTIDAGSHGSRIHIYSWRPRRYDPRYPMTGPVTFPEYVGSSQVSPGISTLASPSNESVSASTSKAHAHQEKHHRGAHGNKIDSVAHRVRENLGPLLHYAITLLSKETNKRSFATFPIYLKATAGMRDLSVAERDLIMGEIRRAFQDKSFSPFYSSATHFRVISGEEEGVYGWLAANQKRKTLLPTPEMIRDEASSLSSGIFARSTTGWLDLGGASTQITFIPQHTSILEDMFPVHIGGHYLRLFSHSFLKYGYADALKRVKDLLIADWLDDKPCPSSERSHNATPALHHPCLSKGSTQMYEPFAIRNDDEKVRKKLRRCFADPLDGKRDDEKQTTVRLLGTGDFDACRMVASRLLIKIPCFLHTCSFNGVYLPRILDSTFVASGAFSDVRKSLKDISSTPSLSEWQRAATLLCQEEVHHSPNAKDGGSRVLTSTELLGASQEKVAKDGRAEEMCWKAVWVYTLLRDGFGFSPSSRQIAFSHSGTRHTKGEKKEKTEASEDAFSWAFGSMIFELNYYPWTAPSNGWQLFGYVALILLAFSLAITCYLFWQVQHLRSRGSPPRTRAPYSLLTSHIPPSLPASSTPLTAQKDLS